MGIISNKKSLKNLNKPSITATVHWQKTEFRNPPRDAGSNQQKKGKPPLLNQARPQNEVTQHWVREERIRQQQGSEPSSILFWSKASDVDFYADRCPSMCTMHVHVA